MRNLQEQVKYSVTENCFDLEKPFKEDQLLQGPGTQIDEFETNIFPCLNEILHI